MRDFAKWIAIYLRTSIEDYGKAHRLLDQSLSIVNQRALIRAFLTEHEEFRDMEAVEYIDDGYTGTNTNRPRFQDLLRDVEGGRVAAILVKDLSRLGRSYLEVGDYLERVFPQAGVRVITITDGYDSNQFIGSTGGVDVTFRNFIYDSYSKDLSTKVRSAMRVRMEKGKFVNHTPYGYMKSPEDKHVMIPDPDTAPVVQEIFRLILDGKTTAQVATSLNDRNIPTPLQYKQHKIKPACQDRKLLWTHITVVNVLHNYKYTGAMINHTRESRHLRDNNQRRTSPEEWIITENAHQPLVSKEDFEQANAMLRHSRKAERTTGKSGDSVFYCGHCGRKLQKTHGTDVYFSCTTPSYQTDAACKGLRWSKRKLEEVLFPIYRVQLALLGEQAMIHQRGAVRQSAPNYIRQMGRLEQEINGCDQKKMELFEAYHDGALTLEAYMEQKTALTEHAQALRTQLTVLEADYRKAQEDREQAEMKQARLTSFLSANTLPEEEQIQRMYEAIDRVTVFEERLDVRWKFDDLFAADEQGTEKRAS